MRFARPWALVAWCAGCSTSQFQMPPGVEAQTYLSTRGTTPSLGSVRFRPEVCEGFNLRPDDSPLNEASFVGFLQSQKFSVDAQRQQVDPQRPELHYVFATVPGFPNPVPLRVAVLANADSAARSLHSAVLEYGKGSWGVHRSNVAVLGPKGSQEDILAFAAATKMACWGTVTVADTDDTFVVPGGYQEP